MTTERWRPRLAAGAKGDLREIAEWTRHRFGPAQALLYRETILAAIRELERGPDQPGIRNWDDIAPGLKAIHVARHRRRGRHFVVFRVDPSTVNTIEILRLLHDTMDFVRQLTGPSAPSASA